MRTFARGNLKNIYTPGVFDLEMKGGCFWDIRLCGFERNRRRGVASCQVAIGGRWGQPDLRLHAPHAPVHLALVHCLNGSCSWPLRLAL